jgi:predicted negative regulator of RcsB-dependent stress response
MPRSRSPFAAPLPERPRLARPSLIVALTLGVIAILVFLYFQEDLVLRLAANPEGPLSAAYLRALLTTEPDNPRLRLLVAGNLLRAGRFDELEATLRPALEAADLGLRREALWLLWQAEGERQREAPPAVRHQRQLRHKALTLELLALESDPQRRAQLAGQLLTLGEMDTALTVFRELEQRNPGTLLLHLEQAAAQALARGNYAAAAEIHLAARRHATTLTQRREYFLAALRDLESGNRPEAALALAERELMELADDRAVLLELVRLARAVPRPDRAEHYVRRLLRMSLLKYRSQLAAGSFGMPQPMVADSSTLPFDDPQVYELAYTVFLENRKIADAYRVAASAVHQAPDNLLWRRRLAQVAEWSNRPDEALEQWLFIARRSGDADAWEAVRRLSLGLLRDDAYEAWLKHRLARGFDAALVLALAQTQERQGRPETALATLEAGWRQSHAAPLAQAAAELAEQLGDLAAALTWWRRLATQPGAETALRIATLEVLQGEYDAARRTLEQLPPEKRTPAVLRLLAELAVQMGDRPGARRALEALAASSEAQAGDLATLEALLADEPMEAARVALLAWQRFRDQEALLRALSAYQAAARFDEAQTVFAGLDADTRHRLEASPRYCLLAARQAWQRGELGEARRFLARAERLAPEDLEVAETTLWFAVETADTQVLREKLSRFGAKLAEQRRTEVLIAVYNALGRLDLAWRLAAAELPRHRDDPVWLIMAAYLLEALDRHDEAWQLRRYAVKLVQGRPRDGLAVARASLAASLVRGDTALAALRAALAEDPKNASSLLLARWIQEGEYSWARAWMYGLLAREAARPRWAELSVALVEDDLERLSALLEEPAGLPRRDAVEAARRLDPSLAASLAFAHQEWLGMDDDLQAQLDPLLRQGAARVGLVSQGLRFPGLDELQNTVTLEGAALPWLRLGLDFTSVFRHLRDRQALGQVVNERRTTFRATTTKEIGGGMWEVNVGYREGFSARLPASVLWRRRRGTLAWEVKAARAQPAEESLPLRMAGEKDVLGLKLNLAPVQPFALSLQATAQRYYSQTGAPLGKALSLEFHATAALRQEDPDLFFNLFAAHHRFAARAVNNGRLTRLLPAGATTFGSDFFLPPSFTQLGFTLSSRTAYQEADSRALKPFWALTLSWSSAWGLGHDVLLGVGGSVFGADHLALGVQWGRTLGTIVGDTFQVFLNYRYNF